NVSAYISLNSNKKGVNMSRFSQVITEKAKDKIGSQAIEEILKALHKELENDNIYIKFSFNYLTKVKAPKSKIISWFDIPITMEGELVNGKIKKFMTVDINYTSLCPCSKEISKYGAHNQRSVAKIKVELNDKELMFEELKAIVDKSVSCPIYNTLKRVDEKWVTERAYENPYFSEDICRNISSELDLLLDKKIIDYVITTEHFESIHQSSAVTIMNAGRNLK
ncbi:MAG: GTP cyclohydrolase, FolE2/MptA family, partial [Methanothrix sp.]|nr:GTP cyclohydrolase, FolE2/MptA family [Methanothrix sp.]